MLTLPCRSTLPIILVILFLRLLVLWHLQPNLRCGGSNEIFINGIASRDGVHHRKNRCDYVGETISLLRSLC